MWISQGTTLTISLKRFDLLLSRDAEWTRRTSTSAKDNHVAVTIFDGLDEIINAALKIDETWTYRGSPIDYADKASLIRLQKGLGQKNVDCGKLIDALFDHVNQTWNNFSGNDRVRRPSFQNWRRVKNPDFDPGSTSDEVVLERTITQVTDGNWWNQIPVDQTLLGVRKGKVIDLVHRDGPEGRDFELVELKTGGKYTPLSATGQVLKYGIVYAFYRSRYREFFDEDPAAELLKSAQITLVVLAPWAFYKPFKKYDWLSQLEVSLDKALQKFAKCSESGLKEMGFKFQTFPNAFTWSAAMANDERARKEVLWAVHNRVPVFTR